MLIAVLVVLGLVQVTPINGGDMTIDYLDNDDPYNDQDPNMNFLENGDMEDSTSDAWQKNFNSVVLTYSATDPHEGTQSLVVSNRPYQNNRNKQFAGVKQRVLFNKTNGNGEVLGVDRLLYISCFILVDTTSNEVGTAIKYADAHIVIRTKNVGGGWSNTRSIGRRGFIRGDHKYWQLGADFVGPKSGGPVPEALEIGFRVIANVPYRIDKCALTIIPPLPADWRGLLEERIIKHRRGKLTITSKLTNAADRGKVKVQIKLKERALKVGPAMNPSVMKINSVVKTLKEKKRMNAASMWNAMKWKNMEAKKGKVFDGGLRDAVKKLVSMGFSVRFHTLLWEILKSNPTWVWTLDQADLLSAMERRVEDVCTRYSADNMKVWAIDVQNEFQHGHFYESRTKDSLNVDLISKMFNLCKSYHPDGIMTTSDYQALRDGQMTSVLANQAKDMLAMNASIDATGAQGHMRIGDGGIFHLERFLQRLRVLAKPGIDIHITEFTIHALNITKRAFLTEEIMYALYSQKQVKGVILWGYSENFDGLKFEDDTGLYVYNGRKFVPNDAGIKMNELLDKWTFSKTKKFKAKKLEQSKSYELYQGVYTIDMVKDNTIHVTQDVTMEGGVDKTVIMQFP